MKFNDAGFKEIRVCLTVGLISTSIFLTGCGGEDSKDSEPTLPESPEAVDTGEAAADTREEGSDTSPAQSASTELEVRADWRELWNSAAFGQLIADADYYLENGSEGALESIALTYLFLSNSDAAEATAEGLSEDAPLRIFLRAMGAVYADPSNEDNAKNLLASLDSWEAEEGSQEEQWKLNARGFALSEVGMRAMGLQSLVECVAKWPDNAVALRNLARSYRAARMPEFTVSILKQWVSRHGENPEARQIYSQTLLELDLIDEAQAFADTAYARFPGDPAAIANLARVYLLQGDVDVAEQLLEQTATNQPDDMAIRVLLASAQLRNGKWETALETLASTEIPSGLRTAAAEIEAFAQMDAGRFGDAIAALNRFDIAELSPASRFLRVAARIAANEIAQAAGEIPDPGTAAILYSDPSRLLSAALGASSEFADAADGELAGALARDSGAAANFALAVACYFSGLNDKSYALFESLLEQMGDHPRLASYSLSALARSTDIRGLSALAGAAVEKYSGHSEIWMAASIVHGAAESEEAQRSALDRAIELAPSAKEPLQLRANLAIADGDDVLALALFKRLLELEPDSGSTLNNISYFITKTGGDLEMAIDYAQRALDLLKSNPDVLHTLGWAQLQSGLLEEAEENLRFALQQRPGDPTISLDYGRLLIAQGNEEDGMAQLRVSISYADRLGIAFPRRAEAESKLAEAN